MVEQGSKDDEAPMTTPEIQNGTVAEVADPGVEGKEITSSGGSEKDLGGEGSRTFTMRELLNELKVEEAGARNEVSGGEDEARRVSTAASDGSRRDGESSFSQDSFQRQSLAQNDVSMELINRISGIDDEGRSRQKILSFSAKRYADAIEKNPNDHDAYYNWALVLQESADIVGPESTNPSKDALLEEACKKYAQATQLCPTLHDATRNYEKAVQLNWNSPQAYNNWGLALQELSNIVPVREKQNIVRMAISKFRASIRLQFDFHRAIYNLGTVLYGLAEDTPRPVNTKEVSQKELYSQSAIYIAAAHALKPSYSVYRSALKLVQRMIGKDDRKSTENLSSNLQGSGHSDKSLISVDIPDILSVSACADLTLPPGAGLCIDTVQGPVFLVADAWESLDGWLDAIRLVYTVYARGKSDVLAGILAS
ncbi:hypothetical protein AXF42_Ash012647 [Apostasia shenzhenica]|uniref:Uncharacterized protein n=1 Tax=Apostasia shenzhenica TaxID=1088818 RepID=A0A2H9ZT97_9ASPA|nr:hypothetical protein AXF42_Ash012647 [Apostasia shenzhenica]